MSDFSGIISERIKKLILEKNLTQNAVAAEIGISRQAVSQYCDGSSVPNADKLAKLAKLFGVSADYILGLNEQEDKEVLSKKRIDCNITDNFFKELSRMVPVPEDYLITIDLRRLSEVKNEVQKWSDEHPVKTRLDDLFEKYPNFHTDNGRPNFYPRVFGYCDNCKNCPIWNDDDYVPGKSCWDEPFENGMTGDRQGAKNVE